MPRASRWLLILLPASLMTSCMGLPETVVVMENQYPPASGLVVYRAFWQAVPFQTPVLPGLSSAPQGTLPASANTAYVLLAPGYNPASATAPSSIVVLQSRGGFSVSLGQTLDIPIDDTTFAGNCATGSFLTQAQADFITQRVFASDFVSLQYDAATCTLTPATDGGP